MRAPLKALLVNLSIFNLLSDQNVKYATSEELNHEMLTYMNRNLILDIIIYIFRFASFIIMRWIVESFM